MNLGFGWAVPGFGWRSGVVNIDEAFLTPLLATQSINLALETIIPWICHKREHTRTTKRKAADVVSRCCLLFHTCGGNTTCATTSMPLTIIVAHFITRKCATPARRS